MPVEFKYDPLPKQEMFHNAPQKYRLYAGGYGSAKTTAGVIDMAMIGLRWKRNLLLITRATYPELRDTTRKEFLEIPVEVNGKEYAFGHSPLVTSWNKSDNHMTLMNGTEILFRPLDKLDKIKSLNLGAFLMDEATEFPEDTFLALTGRLRRVLACSTCGKKPPRKWVNGKVVQTLICPRCNVYTIQHFGLATTNPEGHDWVWKRWVAGAERLQEWKHPTAYGELSTFEAVKGDYYVVTATSDENPYLPENYVPDMLSNYPEEWVKRYVYGSFETFSGNIYHEFRDEKPYVVPAFELPEDWYRFVGIDHGLRNPTAVLWLAVSPEGRVYVYDEFYASGKLVSELVEIIKLKSRGQDIRRFLIDPATRNRNGVSGLSVMDEFHKYRLMVEPANNDVRAGINRVKERLALKAGKPALVIFSNCVQLRTELQTYRYKDLKPGAIQDGPEKPVKKNDHAVDALRYSIAYLYDTPEVRTPARDWHDYSFLKHRSTRETEDHWMAA